MFESSYNNSTLSHHPLSTAICYQRPTQICCISLHGLDKIRLIKVPQHLISPLRLAIFEAWDRPVQKEGHLERSDGYEFKLKGNPWSYSHGSDQHIAARKLILELMRVMEMRGWLLILASNASYVKYEKDVLFFEWVGPKRLIPASDELRLLPCLFRQSKDQHNECKRESWEEDLENMSVITDMSHEQNEMNGLKARTKKESKEKEEVELFALDFSMADTIRVIEAPVNVITEIRHAICMHWRQGIQRECVNSGAYEFKLKGYPFRSTKSKDIIDTLMMLIQILENVRLHAFKVCASMDMNVVSEEDESIDTWMFRRTGHNRQRNELDGWVVEL